jgi:hypothetical protein
MKTRPFAYLLALALPVLVISCDKDDDEGEDMQLESKQYVLYNDTTGAELNAGTFTVKELSDGNTAIDIALSDSFKVNDASFDALIVSFNDITQRDSVYASLGQVNGATGRGAMSPVIWSSTNAPIRYDSLISLDNYRVVVMRNDSTVYAEGAID